MTLAERHRGALAAIEDIVDREASPATIVDHTVGALHDRFDHYSWIGVYHVEGGDLVLGPWRGPAPTEHTRIPIGASTRPSGASIAFPPNARLGFGQRCGRRVYNRAFSRPQR